MAELLICDCGRRYLRTTMALEATEDAFELCQCERKLGEWSGTERYVFEPEQDGD